MQIDEDSPPQPKNAAGKWALGGGAALAVATFVAWLGAGVVIDRGVDHWRADMTERGVFVVLSAAGGAFDGFPLTSKRRFAAVEIKAAGLRLTASAAEISYSLLTPESATLTFSGATVEKADGGKGQAGVATLTVALTQRPLNGGGALPAFAQLRLTGAAWEGWRLESVAADLRFADPPAADHAQPGLFFNMTGEGVVPPAEIAAPFGPADGRGKFDVAATVMGAPPALTAAALETWRVDGGVIELGPLRADFASLAADGDGTLALDRDLQPIAAGTLRMAGVDAALARAAQHGGGPFKPKEIKQARQVAMMLTQPDPNGGPPRLTLPLSIQDRRLSVGPFQLLKLPQLTW